MPNSAQPYSWPQFARDFLTVLQVVALAYVANVGSRNHGKIEQVETRQVEQVETAESVKATLERKAAAERAALEANLRASWKYLDSVAYESELPKDKEAAAAAKRAYEEFKAKNGG